MSYGATSYVYTTNGDLKAKIESGDTTRYFYDAFGNLVQAMLPTGDIIEYVIDGQNRRVAKKVNGRVVQKFIYSSLLNIVAELDSTDQVVGRFAPGSLIKAGKTYQLITDQLGSVRLVLDASTGSVVQRLDYDEFGNVLLDSNPGFQPLGYAGGLYDLQTKLLHFGARDYDPRSGRWTSKDPVNLAGGMELYVYVGNDPINCVDTRGLGIEHLIAGQLAHRYILAALRARLGPRNIGVEPLPRGGPNGGYGFPDLLVAGPCGTEVYELKTVASAATANAQLDRYIKASGDTYVRGTSLVGDAYVLSPVPVIKGLLEFDLKYMEPGIIGYEINYKGPDPKPALQKLVEIMKDARFQAAAAATAAAAAVVFFPELAFLLLAL